MANVRAHEMSVTSYAMRVLDERLGDQLTIHGPRNIEVRGGILSLALPGVHPHDVSQVLDQTNVCVRAGHHCAKPLMRQLGVGATARASFYVYNDEADADALADGLVAATDFFSPDRRTAWPARRPLREIILDHYRSPRNRGELPAPPAHKSEGFNPLCGDEIEVYLDVHDGVVDDIKIGGQGCSISHRRRR